MGHHPVRRPYREAKMELRTHRERDGVVLTQGKECEGLLATSENKTGMEHIQKNCRREPTLATPGFQTSSLQMTQRINLCGLKHPGCGTCYSPGNLKRNYYLLREALFRWSVCSRRSDLCLLRKDG